MQKPTLNIVLVEPDIPWNTGAIGRTCVALNLRLILIHPIGFSTDEKAVRRAGLDYWQHVDLVEYQNWQEFLENEQPENTFLYTISGDKNFFDAQYKINSYLVFGSESKGLDEFYHEAYRDNLYQVPMFSDKIRSLNLANTATAVIYEAIRQIKFT